MTDSSIDENSGDDGFDVGASADDLFGAIADESGEGAVDRGSTNADDDTNSSGGTESTSGRAGGIEDQTASNVFGQLKADVASPDDGTDDVLEGETPEEIIASADEPDSVRESTVDDDLIVDEEELEDLLLTGRTKDQEFLWVDPDESAADADDSGDSGDSEAPEPPDLEAEREADTAVGADTATETGADADVTASESEPEPEDEDEPTDQSGLVIADNPSRSTSATDGGVSRSARSAAASDTADASADESTGLLGWLRSKLPLL